MIKYMLLIILLAFVSCKKETNDELPVQQGVRIISFAGYDWVVEDSSENTVGPGPNFFSSSEDNVWVDNQGRLHLKIVQRGGKWYCSKVVLWNAYGYHKYVFYVDSRVDQLDKNVVAGLFAYKNDEEEIDIEFSKWGDTNKDNSQFAIQPSVNQGNKVRFNLLLEDNHSTHFFNWQKESIEFGSYLGNSLMPSDEEVVKTWTYTGKDIPTSPDLRIKINLWLFKGKFPSDNQDNELVIRDFKIL